MFKSRKEKKKGERGYENKYIDRLSVCQIFNIHNNLRGLSVILLKAARERFLFSLATSGATALYFTSPSSPGI